MAPALHFRLSEEQPASNHKPLADALRRQLHGILVESTNIGTMFSISSPSGEAVKVILVAVSEPGRVDEAATITLETSAVRPAVGHGVSTVPAAITDGLRQYISAASIASVADESTYRAAELGLGRLRGVPAFDVAGDITTRLRGAGSLDEWARRHHGSAALRGLRTIQECTSLILLAGDPGTGKSALMRQVAPVCARDIGETVMFIQLNERLRGQGIQGRAGSELITVVETVAEVAEEYSLPTIVFLDEADAVASSRGTDDIGSGAQENVAIVDGLIVALDRVSWHNSARVVFVMATNLVDRIDPAVLRRASVYRFQRPDKVARRAILDDLLGDALTAGDLERIDRALTRPDLPLTAADIANQVVAKAIREAALRDHPLVAERLIELASAAAISLPVRPT